MRSYSQNISNNRRNRRTKGNIQPNHSMTISITKDKRTITISSEVDDLEHLVDEFISCLLVLDYDGVEIKETIIKVAEIIKNKQ